MGNFAFYEISNTIGISDSHMSHGKILLKMCLNDVLDRKSHKILFFQTFTTIVVMFVCFPGVFKHQVDFSV